MSGLTEYVNGDIILI